MKWRKLGLLFCPENNFTWMLSHASNPIAEIVNSSNWRIYFSTRDKDNRSSIGCIELDITDPRQGVNIPTKPLVSPGEVGLFDDSGASMSCLVSVNETKYLYYTGWCLGVTVPWRNSIGLAVCHQNSADFQKYTKAPIMDRSHIDPFSLSYPWVMRDKDIWKMWYGSNLSWGSQHSDMKHVIKYAESVDGIHWERRGQIAIPLTKTDEWGVAKPCILHNDSIYQMWYSIRFGKTYRIGYAESTDGVDWQRKDNQVGIDVSDAGWDSEMIEYPCVFDHAGERYMLYNGNGFGKTGFGLAILEQD